MKKGVHFWLFSKIAPDWSLRADNFWVADYVWTNLTMRYIQDKKKWETALMARNLLDVDARQPAPGAIPGRSIMLELRAHF